MKNKAMFSEIDSYYFHEGTHCLLYNKLGAHTDGHRTVFAVWAPNVNSVSIIGEFNNWEKKANPLKPTPDSHIWTGSIIGNYIGALYKYHINPRNGGPPFDKADPFAFESEKWPGTASQINSLEYDWGDMKWMQNRCKLSKWEISPISIYEVHLPSWAYNRKDGGENFRTVAEPLLDHVKKLGFTHIELLPIMNHPEPQSWGYKVTGYFCPTSQYGSPQDLMYFIDYMHKNGIGVILDWPPAHFAPEPHGLTLFDGTPLFEHPDWRRGYNPQWTSMVFNWEKPEVCSFLKSVGFFWLDKYHFDGFRIDAVTSMLYLDYARKNGEWLPNEHGGIENWPAKRFLQCFNQSIYKSFPGVEIIAEESTAWPGVTKYAHDGGLGFGFKWDVGWTNDILRYMSKDPIYRKYHQDSLTFRILYYTKEKFILPLGHDEVTHGRGTLFQQMAGRNSEEKFAQIRLLYTFMFANPGKKLLFMGNEFGNSQEWNYEKGLQWELINDEAHRAIVRLVRDLNNLYVIQKSLHSTDCLESGFEWIDCNDIDQSVVSFVRKNGQSGSTITAIFNFTPVLRYAYRIGISDPGIWKVLINSDSKKYGGAGLLENMVFHTDPIEWHGRANSLNLLLPPLSGILLEHKTRLAPHHHGSPNKGL